MDEYKFSCPRCGIGMNQKFNLKIHINNKKACTPSSKDMNRDELMEYYNSLDRNTKKTPFQCEHCKKYYSCNSSLIKHMNSHAKKEESIASLIDKLHDGLKNIEELKSQISVQTINNNITNTNITLNCFYSPKIDHVNWFDAILDEDEEIVDPIK